MKRREFIALLGATAAWPRQVQGQKSMGVARVGVLSPFSASIGPSPVFDTFNEMLRKLG
jgi:hypothetical protein